MSNFRRKLLVLVHTSQELFNLMGNAELILNDNIAFWHSVALMCHLYTFISVLNATLFTITPLRKNKNKKLSIRNCTCFDRIRPSLGNCLTCQIAALHFQCN
jgi:hypothetical protein